MKNTEGGAQARSTADAVARRSYGKLVAFLVSRTRDVAAAEDALSEAFASALTDWPLHGCPSNPEGWLLTVARRKTIDAARRRRRHEDLAGELPIIEAPEEEIPDKRLALMFTCAHPAIESGIHAPLILQAVLGLDAKVIASAFLTSPAAMGKRLVRAKEKIRQAGIPFAIPEREELPGRLNAVLDAIYAAFAEGWSDPGGTDAARRDLTDESMFLARLVTELLPDEPEALGLLALMLHAEARRRARRQADGEYVPARRARSGRVGCRQKSPRRKRCSSVRPLSARSAATNSKARCNRRMSIAAAPAAPTGRKWCSFMTRCWPSPILRWWRSIALWPSRNCKARTRACRQSTG